MKTLVGGLEAVCSQRSFEVQLRAGPGGRAENGLDLKFAFRITNICRSLLLKGDESCYFDIKPREGKQQ